MSSGFVSPKAIGPLVLGFAIVFYWGYETGKQQSDTSKREEHKSAPDSHAVISETELLPANQSSGIAALAAEQVFNSKSDISYKFSEIIANLEAKDAPALLDQLLSIEQNENTVVMLSLLFEKWGQVEGSTALEFARSFDGALKKSFMTQALIGWASENPESAWIAFLRESKNGLDRSLKPSFIIHAIALKNPSEAFNMISDPSLIHISKARANYSAIVKSASQTRQMDSLLNTVLSTSDSKLKDEVLSEIFRTWSSSDLDAAIRSLPRVSNPSSADTSLAGLIIGWAEEAPEAALEFAISQAQTPKIKQATTIVSNKWISSANGDEIAGFFSSIENLGQREALIIELSGSISKTHPDQALALVETISDQNLRNSKVATAVSYLASSDLSKAESYYHSVQDASLKQRIGSGIAMTHARMRSDPEMLAEYIDLAPTGVQRDRLVTNIAQSIKLDRQATDKDRDAYTSFINSIEGLSESVRLKAIEGLSE